MMYAAEIATSTGHIIIVDHNRKALLSNLVAIVKYIGFTGDAEAIGTVEADDCNVALDCVRRGDWNYSQRV